MSNQKTAGVLVAFALETANLTQSLIGASFTWHILKTSPLLTACSNNISFLELITLTVPVLSNWNVLS